MIDAVVFLYSVATIFLPAATEPAAARAPLSPALVKAIASRPSDAPDVDVWLHDDEYDRGDVARVEFRARDDAYVTVIRVDTDGRLQVLFPTSPHRDAWVRRGESVRVPGRHGGTFMVDDDRGLGYVFAIASYDRFDFRRFSDGDRWDEHALGGRIHGDPFVAMHRVAERLLWDDRSPYSTDYDEYYVERRVEYPRYVCYDCHSGARRPHWWDPYDHHCTQFRVVIWSDPYYYPYRYYPGTRVVYARRPRYEFKEASPREPITRTTSIERRRRDEGLDFRRPNSPTEDPNLPGGGRRRPGGDDTGPSTGGGSTDPGGDVPSGGSKPGRRRGHEADGPGSSNDAPGHTGQRPPRRDDQPGNGGGSGNGGDDDSGAGNGGNGGGNGNPDRPRAPRREGHGSDDARSPGNDGGNGGNGGSAGHGGSGDPGGSAGRRNGPPRRDDGGNAGGGASSDAGVPDERRGDGPRRDSSDDGDRDDDERGSGDRSSAIWGGRGGDRGSDRSDGGRRTGSGGETRPASGDDRGGSTRGEPRSTRRAEPKSGDRGASRASSSGGSKRSGSASSSRGGSSKSSGDRGSSTRRRSP